MGKWEGDHRFDKKLERGDIFIFLQYCHLKFE